MFLIENFPLFSQFPEYPTGCESVSLYMLLKYYNIDVSVEDVVNSLKKGERPHYENDVLYGGNPEREFVGDPTSQKGLGVYEKPIIEVANKYKPGIINISGTSFEKVLELVKKGYPIQVWTSINCLEPKISDFSWIDKKTNEKIMWKQPFHSVVLIGYTKNSVFVADPYYGKVKKYDKLKFEKAFDFFGKRAIYYKK